MIGLLEQVEDDSPKIGLGRGRADHPDHLISAHERRIAMLAAAGLSNPAIAIQLETNSAHVKSVLDRSHVARFVTRLCADLVDEIRPVARKLNEEMEIISGEAFDRQVGVMRKLDQVGDEALDMGDLKNGIRAKLGVLTSTQDILDRAGKRAPARAITGVIHAVAPEQLERLERIIGEATGKEAHAPQCDARSEAPKLSAESNTLPSNAPEEGAS